MCPYWYNFKKAWVQGKDRIRRIELKNKAKVKKPKYELRASKAKDTRKKIKPIVFKKVDLTSAYEKRGKHIWLLKSP